MHVIRMKLQSGTKRYIYRPQLLKTWMKHQISLDCFLFQRVHFQDSKILPCTSYSICNMLNYYLCILSYIQGGAVNHGLKRFFSLYRPSCHIEAYIRPEKYWMVWAGPLANHHSILTSFFLATAQRRRRKERHVWRICTAASRRYSTATNGRRAAKFAWGVAWPFVRPMLPVEKSSEFKFAEYSGQSAENQNSANGR